MPKKAKSPTIAGPAAKVLGAMMAGTPLVATRVMPFPHQYHLVRNTVERDEVGLATVASLAQKGLIKGHVIGDTWDRIEYALTEQGIAAARTISEEGKRQ